MKYIKTDYDNGIKQLKVAIMNAYEYWKEINQGEDVLTESDIDRIFILIEQEYNNNFNRFRNNILNYNKY